MIYSTSADNSSRFLLGEKGTKPLVVVGVNPSTATDKEFDQTIKKIRGFSERKGFNGWLMINLYPQRTTDPRKLHRTLSDGEHRANLKAIKSAITTHDIKKPTVWAAWGGEVLRRGFLCSCLADVADALAVPGAKWVHIGTLTKDGHPRHPARLGYDQPVSKFDIKKYQKTICRNGR
jgi:hypothetical protein